MVIYRKGKQVEPNPCLWYRCADCCRACGLLGLNMRRFLLLFLFFLAALPAGAWEKDALERLKQGIIPVNWLAEFNAVIDNNEVLISAE